MNGVDLHTIPTFDLSSERNAGELTLRLSGDANLDAVEVVARALAAAHEEAMCQRYRRVVVDLLALQFMNSACFKRLVTWVNRLRAEDAASRYTIHIVTNPKMYWQRRGIHALQGLAGGLISIEE
jgi:ABC-type transporter Mla MlaB component